MATTAVGSDDHDGDEGRQALQQTSQRMTQALQRPSQTMTQALQRPSQTMTQALQQIGGKSQ